MADSTRKPGTSSRGRARGVPTTTPDEAQRTESALSTVTVSRGGRSPGGSSGGSSGGESRFAGLSLGGNGNGNGNGNGGEHSPPGVRGTSGRGGEPQQQQPGGRSDYVVSRPEGMDSKKGSSGKSIELIANYFKVSRRPDPKGVWRLYKYRVDFEPDDDNIRLKKGLVKSLQAQLGPNICDGHLLYVSKPLAPELAELPTQSRRGVDFLVKIRLVEELNPTDPMYVTFYNNIIKTCQHMLNLTEMNRNYYDHLQAAKYPNRHLELWPGFVTVMRQHENQVLLCIEVVHKVLRTDSILAVMSAIRSEYRNRPAEEMQAAVASKIVGSIVMTEYNRRTYRIDEIKWGARPTDTFPFKGGQKSFVDYYQEKYERSIGVLAQPLLASNPKPRDIRRGQTTQNLLIPEFCVATGLTDELRQDFRLMRELGEHLFMVPETRVRVMTGLPNRIHADENVRREMETWGLRIAQQPLTIPGRVLPSERINLGGATEIPDQKADWTFAFRNRAMLSCVPLTTWVVLTPDREANDVDALLRLMKQVSGPLRFNMSQPETVKIRGVNPQGYLRAIDDAMRQYQSKLDMFFIVLPNNKLELYSAVKKHTYVEYGVPSQCFLSKNTKNKSLMNIATKVVIQMNAKLGGEPWSVDVPLKNMMVVGFDVYHGATSDRRGQSVGAMTCSLSKNCTRYFSTISFHGSNEELSMNICANFTKCLTAYQTTNGQLPERVMFFRDGVGEGQLPYVHTVELEELKKAMTIQYTRENVKKTTFSFIVVTKRINTRIMQMIRGKAENPPPGTVVDDVITLPERYDFFIVSPNVRQGTVSPTSYNVLYDDSGLGPDKIQRMTFKLCHMYYNWSGTVAVPAPVQYAHKLAFLTGTALGQPAHRNLAHLLYYL